MTEGHEQRAGEPAACVLDHARRFRHGAHSEAPPSSTLAERVRQANARTLSSPALMVARREPSLASLRSCAECTCVVREV